MECILKIPSMDGNFYAALMAQEVLNAMWRHVNLQSRKSLILILNVKKNLLLQDANYIMKTTNTIPSLRLITVYLPARMLIRVSSVRLHTVLKKYRSAEFGACAPGKEYDQ